MVEHKEEFSRYMNHSPKKAARSYSSDLSETSRELGMTIGLSTISVKVGVQQV